MFRKFVCCFMIALVPAALMAADSGAAMMYTKGSTWLNGSAVPRSSAIFPGDLVQTRTDSVAKINAPGVNVAVLSDSLVKFEGGAVSLDHGRVAIGTSKGTSTRAGEVTVTPAANSWTEFQVNETDGRVEIMARKGNLSINDATGTTMLSEGQQTTRFASYDRKGGAAPAAGGGILDSPIAIGVGIAAIAGLVTWVLLQGSEPASNSTP